MFDIGWSEMLLVAVVAIVVIGPKDLPAALRQAGKWMAAVRRMAADFQGQVNEAMKEAELDGLRKEIDELKRTTSGFTNPVDTVRNEVRAAIEAKEAPKEAPTAATAVAAGMATAGPLASEVPEGEPVAATETAEEIVTPRPADLPAPASPDKPADFTAATETKP
jgi:sec-independent protein translocase protein TatB